MSNRTLGLGSYLERMPPEVRRAIEGLDNEVRQAIAIALSEHGRLRFSDLQHMLGISKSDLAFHLNRLVQAGLASHIYEEFPSEESRAYYRLSDLGESLLGGIARAFVPPPTPAIARPVSLSVPFHIYFHKVRNPILCGSHRGSAWRAFKLREMEMSLFQTVRVARERHVSQGLKVETVGR